MSVLRWKSIPEESIWNQDRQTREGGVRELTGGNFHTVVIFLRGERKRTGEAA
ncbi:MAG: hypothetical protein JW883_07260 [Deltaproteobacteria bacterium]|nr:hypothetical protein [Deltaproteobacteria bacterium]